MALSRRLSMRKSDGSIVDSSEEESTSIKKSEMSRNENLLHPFIPLAKFYFNAYSKSLSKKIQIEINRNSKIERFWSLPKNK